MSEFLTIRQTARKGPYPEHQLRKMQKRGELPGFYSGSRYYVNFDMLMEQLEKECRSRMKEVN